MEKIKIYSDNLNYEMAGELKKELEYIDYIISKQKVELHDLVNRDIIGYYYKNGYVSINVFYLRNGKLVGNKNDIFPYYDEIEETLEYYIANFYLRHEIPKEIIISKNLNKDVLKNVVATNFITPYKGIKKGILDMAEMNAKVNYDNKFKLLENEEERTSGANLELAKLLGMKHLRRIDIFDNSNLFGEFSVSAMVVYIDGKPAKNEYRKYKISFDKNDDYHMMQEVMYRRYQRALVEQTQLPDLLIVDGGEIQMNATKMILKELDLENKIKVVGLIKDDKHRTSELIDSNLTPIKLDQESNVFHFLTRMQDEVHRFVITYHRTIRSKGSISSVLDNINGIGEKRKKQLIKKYGSILKMKNATLDELNEILPKETAKQLYVFLKNYKRKDDVK